MKRIIIGVIALIIAAVAWFSCTYYVAQDQYAVVIQFGKIVATADTPGLRVKAPFIQTVATVPKSLQLYDISPSDVITQDKKSMIADDYILWKVSDPVKFMQTLNGSTSSAQDRAGVAVYNSTKTIISSLSQDGIIAARGEKLTSMITEDANSDVGGYGIVIVKAAIKSLDLPDDNKQAVYDRMISERSNIAASYQAQGNSEAKKIQNETDRDVTIKKSDAKKKAAVLEAEGEEQYMQTLQEVYNTPEKADFYNYKRSLDALKKSLSGKTEKTIILDKDSELVKVLYGVK